jgi:hypothetical protein
MKSSARWLAMASVLIVVPAFADVITNVTCSETPPNGATVTQTNPSNCQIIAPLPFGDVASASISNTLVGLPGSPVGSSFSVNMGTSGNFSAGEVAITGISTLLLSSNGPVRAGFISFAESFGFSFGLASTLNSTVSVGSLYQSCTQFAPAFATCTGTLGLDRGNRSGILPFTLGQAFTFQQMVNGNTAKGSGSVPHFGSGETSFSFSLLEADRSTAVTIVAAVPEPRIFCLLASGLTLLLCISELRKRDFIR